MDGTLELGVVEGVERLPLFEHDVVGDVDKRGNRADTAPLETAFHPFGRCCAGIDAGNDPARVERAGVGSIEDDLAPICAADLRFGNSREACRARGQCGNLTRNTGERKAVGTVWRELKSQQAIVKIKVSPDAFANRRIGRQDQQAGGVFCNAEFLGRAKHPGRLDTAHLGDLDCKVAGQAGAGQGARNFQARGDIGCATDDLLWYFATDVHTTDIQTICIRMLGNFEYMGHDDIVEGRRDARFFFDFKAGHGKQV